MLIYRPCFNLEEIFVTDIRRLTVVPYPNEKCERKQGLCRPRCSTCRDESATLCLSPAAAIGVNTVRPGQGQERSPLFSYQQLAAVASAALGAGVAVAPAVRLRCPCSKPCQQNKTVASRSQIAARRRYSSRQRQSALWEVPPRGLSASADAPLRTPKLAR